MEFSMTNHIRYSALGAALLASTSLAHAQAVETVIAPQPAPIVIAQDPLVTPPAGVVVTQPAAAFPVETVETIRTVQSTAAPKPRIVSRKVVRTRTGNRVTTTQTIVREGVVPAPAPAFRAVTEPTYNEVVQAPAITTVPGYPRLYDVVAPAPTMGAAPMLPAYRYVYEPDRILVIDANTGIAVQALPR
jgi:hypothetical protein